MTQPVYRNEIIPVETKTHRFDILCTCQPGNKIYFVNNLNSGGTGTYENPFGTLLAAENASSAGDIVYVLPGDGTSKGMDSGFITKENQRLIGSAASFRLCDFCIPIMTPDMFPLINNTMLTDVVFGQDVTYGVIMKEGTEVAGLHFDGSNFAPADGSVGAILDPSGNNFTIRKNIFTNFRGAGISREAPLTQGSVKVCGNVFEDIGPYGVIFSEAISDSTLCFKKNSFSIGLATGVEFDGNFTNVMATFCENQFFDTALGVGWIDSDITDSQIKFCNNRFDDMFFGVRLQALNPMGSMDIMGSSITFCDNQFSNMDIGVSWLADGEAELNITEMNTIAFCNNSFQRLEDAGIAWDVQGEGSISLEDNTINFCNNKFQQIFEEQIFEEFGAGVRWFSTDIGDINLNGNAITFCDNLFQQTFFGVGWFGLQEEVVNLEDNTIKFCGNKFQNNLGGVVFGLELEDTTLTDNTITFCGNDFGLEEFGIGFFGSVNGGSITICENSFTNMNFGIGMIEINSATFCLTNNQFSNIFESNLFVGQPFGSLVLGATDSTFCVENNHFSNVNNHVFSEVVIISVDGGSTSSCLRLVGIVNKVDLIIRLAT